MTWPYVLGANAVMYGSYTIFFFPPLKADYRWRVNPVTLVILMSLLIWKDTIRN